MKKIGSDTAVWLKRINYGEQLLSKTTERITFNAWLEKKYLKSQYNLLANATSSVNKTAISVRTSQYKKVKDIQTDDTVIWKGLAYTVSGVETAENTLSLHGHDLIIHLER